jgi:hypothetical protein
MRAIGAGSVGSLPASAISVQDSATACGIRNAPRTERRVVNAPTAIVALDSDVERSAAYAATYAQVGFDDWFIASKEELTQVYAVCRFTDRGPDFYWSSTEIEPVGVRPQYFLAPAQFNFDTRSAVLLVRFVRAFYCLTSQVR